MHFSKFIHNASAIKSKVTYYFIDIEEFVNVNNKDIINKLHDISPKVKNKNEFNLLTKEQKSKIKYLSFFVDGIIISNGGKKAVVTCGYYEDTLSSSENTVILVKKRKKWKVLRNDIL